MIAKSNLKAHPFYMGRYQRHGLRSHEFNDGTAPSNNVFTVGKEGGLLESRAQGHGLNLQIPDTCDDSSSGDVIKVMLAKVTVGW
mmetsp:Transcript_58297/g.102080  ORF Transcript_58297/g.102080 Transcript_58297/m.102080 type:complete len:85 (-) Transcript_58297:35-289(-)